MSNKLRIRPTTAKETTRPGFVVEKRIPGEPWVLHSPLTFATVEDAQLAFPLAKPRDRALGETLRAKLEAALIQPQAA